MAECSISACQKRAHASGLCPMHYQRQRTRGDVGVAGRERLSHKGAACAFAGCEGPRRKREWCAQHYNQWRRIGAVTEIRRVAERSACLVCGADSEKGFRQFCGQGCYVTWRAHGGNRANTVPCACCGASIDLAIRGKAGQLRRSTTRICKDCRVTYRKHGMSVQELAARDGSLCGICGDPVDLGLRRPDIASPSVDHIVPRALGGSNTPENLQLAHLYCNQVKSDSRHKEAI